MLVHSRSRDANRDFVRQLLPGLSGLTPSTFSAIQVHPDAEVPRFVERWRWLYADIAEIRAVSELIDRLISVRENPFSVDLVEDPDAELARVREKMRRGEPARSSEWFEGSLDGEEYLGILLWRRLSRVASAIDRDALDAVGRLVARAEPARFAANLKVEFTGPVAIAIDEQDAIRGDLRLASILCIVLVGDPTATPKRREALRSVSSDDCFRRCRCAAEVQNRRALPVALGVSPSGAQAAACVPKLCRSTCQPRSGKPARRQIRHIASRA